jgi:hypothetical protein
MGAADRAARTYDLPAPADVLSIQLSRIWDAASGWLESGRGRGKNVVGGRGALGSGGGFGVDQRVALLIGKAKP